MAKQDDVGIIKLGNGYYGFRFSILVDGKRIDQRKTVDVNGNRLRTVKQATRARNEAMFLARTERERLRKITRKTYQEVYDEYCETGRKDRAYATIQKQELLWNSRIKEKFGNRFVDDVSVGEIVDFLSVLYYDVGYSYSYVEGFLKMFYLVLGQAYSRNYLDVDSYNKLCVDKNRRIKMPKMKVEDDTEIEIYSQEELTLLDDYFKGNNLETAYLLGRYCGLRIAECFGLKWSNVNLEEGTILIDRQMQYQEEIIKLVPVKTRNGHRTIYMCDKLRDHLREKFLNREKDLKRYAPIIEQRKRLLTDLDGSSIWSTEMVNCQPKGRLLTVGSLKYACRDIKKVYQIHFKYHNLRHTYGTMMAELNTPQHLLCNQMGHAHIHVTQMYYLAVSKGGIEVLKENLNQL